MKGRFFNIWRWGDVMIDDLAFGVFVDFFFFLVAEKKGNDALK